ncbi:MAG: DUF1924 domain-containing protein [Pseudomonadota bacterium]|nr:DUF1924 domain-containing protein [Pseudomonadota bacterium]
MRTPCFHTLIFSGLLSAGAAQADIVDDLLSEYRSAGGGPFSTETGAALWQREHEAADGSTRSCTSCHTGDTRRLGRHAVTGKAIEPLAPSMIPERLSKRRDIEKWLLRNCKWTLGRECTAQEKGDLLSFLKAQ